MIILTGATGAFGAKVLNYLLQLAPASGLVVATQTSERMAICRNLAVQAGYVDVDQAGSLV